MKKSASWKRPAKVAAALFGSLLLLAAGALIWLATVDWNQARGWIAKQVQQRTEKRELVIVSNLEVKPFSLHPWVRAER